MGEWFVKSTRNIKNVENVTNAAEKFVTAN